jgi:hypothetical protein
MQGTQGFSFYSKNTTWYILINQFANRVIHAQPPCTKEVPVLGLTHFRQLQLLPAYMLFSTQHAQDATLFHPFNSMSLTRLSTELLL